MYHRMLIDKTDINGDLHVHINILTMSFTFDPVANFHELVEVQHQV